jgi:hypothetical protein
VTETWLPERLFAVGQEAVTSDDVYTPAWLFDRLGLRFDLDVAAPPGGAPWVPADRFYDQSADGLASPWFGRVWMNPPYSKVTPWVERFVAHRHGVALVPFARSRWLNRLWDTADALVVPANVGSFVWADGVTMRFPVYLAAFGEECVEGLRRLGVVR